MPTLKFASVTSAGQEAMMFVRSGDSKTAATHNMSLKEHGGTHARQNQIDVVFCYAPFRLNVGSLRDSSLIPVSCEVFSLCYVQSLVCIM